MAYTKGVYLLGYLTVEIGVADGWGFFSLHIFLRKLGFFILMTLLATKALAKTGTHFFIFYWQHFGPHLIQGDWEIYLAVYPRRRNSEPGRYLEISAIVTYNYLYILYLPKTENTPFHRVDYLKFH